jgi:hypothetical protein
MNKSANVRRVEGMPEIRKADPAARRRAVMLVTLGALVGALLIVGLKRYSEPFREWLVSEPDETAGRVKVFFLLAAALLSVPLLGFAIYLWSLGTKVLQGREFPPPGYRVVRDTPVITGEAAVVRGCGLKFVALGLVVSAALLWLLLWRLAWLLIEGAA